ncbi:hypothetical protein SAMN04487968_10576 [Nocardioides terrae]|uniref:Uncharacterized protein n=1 Tax=Nocardioides terrae TaxID=574651 RepID=A0A1I1I078_9ACTN|nr:nuclease-related domain-containing protein [Nocardioides terrae]SFC29501.1 hypothetical protein SAMN04487968_10576 [Nocardioides terrae]
MTNDSGQWPTRAVPRPRNSDGGAVSAILGALPDDEWTVFEDVALRGRRTPVQVAVGPQGIFVIESRRPRPFSRDELCSAGVRQDLVVRATRAAASVNARTGLVEAKHVTPVVCYFGREVAPVVAGDVVVCSSRNLLAVMTARPTILDDGRRQLVALDLDTSIGTPARRPVVRKRRRR